MRISAFKEINGFLNFRKKLLTQDKKIRFLFYRFRWNYFPRVNIVSRFPIHVDIETTNRCNLRCVMCPHAFPTPEFKQTLGFMDVNLARQIIDEGSQKGMGAIKLNWRGEALLWREHLAEIIKYAKDKGIIEVIINTNGLLLNEAFSCEIILAGLDQIIFSVDGDSPETYKKIRVGGSFGRLVENIKSFLKIRKSLGYLKPLVRVQMVKMDSNIHEINSFIKRWSPLVDSISFQDYTNRGEILERLQTNEVVKIGRRPCPQIWQRIVITWDGKVIMCCRDWESGDVLGQLDYLNGKNIEHFWKCEKLENIRKIHLEAKLDDIPVCSKCSYKESFLWQKRKADGSNEKNFTSSSENRLC